MGPLGNPTVVALFFVNLAAAAGVWLVMWRRRDLRASVAFHITAFAVGAAVYATMAVWAALTERPEGHIHFVFGVHLFLGICAWIPFLLFLAITYLRALGAVAEDGVTSAEARRTEARRLLEFGQEVRAGKILRELLDADAGDVEARAMMAEVQLKLGKYDMALGSLRLAMAGVDTDQQFARFVFKAAVLLNEHMGDPAAAARELDLIRRRMPDTPEAAKAQEWILRLMDQAASESL